MSEVSARDPVEMVIHARQRDLGGFVVGRVLPAIGRKTVGPFIFFDHMLPADLKPGEGLDVRPHPHISLATVTYLFEGEFVHRDSLGSLQTVRPGDINWMTAGRGIVHSERTDPERRKTGGRSHGLQLWVALPQAFEETEPAFHHHPQETLPLIRGEGYTARLLVGKAYGLVSPVHTFSPMFYLDVQAQDGADIDLPEEYPERAVYLVKGSLLIGEKLYEGPQLILFRAGLNEGLRVQGETRMVFVGGEPLDGRRYIWWNFISSSQERIEQAKIDWREGRFTVIPGDSDDYIPLPED